MFEWMYISKLMEAAQEHPRETAALIAALLLVPGIHERRTQVRLARVKSENDVEIARLERETAEIKFRTAQLYAVDSRTS